MNAPLTPLEIFRAKGIPHRRMEDWKYSDLRSVLDVETVEHTGGISLNILKPPAVEQSSVGYRSGPEWVRPEWAKLSEQWDQNCSAMGAAVRAFDGGSIYFRVPAESVIAEPLTVKFLNAGHCELFLLLERGASLTFLELHEGDLKNLRNIAIFAVLQEGARLTHIRQEPIGNDLVSVELTSVVQEKGAHYKAHLQTGGAKLSRAEYNISLIGEGAEAELYGVGALADGTHADVTTRIEHAAPNTTSRQLFKMVAGGKSRAIYQGKVTVREGAIGSDSRQTTKALLLSNRAEADLKPELEILADDVKCAHGAAVGDLDAESLFYLRSRGIPEADARTMLVRAFLEEAVDRIEDEALRAQAWKFVERGLADAMKASP
jgi:Fe-S cluster assembly protein SufD